MIKIRQKHRTGCAVASTAMLLNISYDEAIYILYPKHKPYQRVPGDVFLFSKIFRKYNIKYQFYFDDIKIKHLKSPSLLIISLVDISKNNHAVVWDPSSKKILDPGRDKSFPIKFYQNRLLFAFELS